MTRPYSDHRRQGPRRALNRPAWLICEQSPQPILCLLVNISDRGARLQVQPDTSLPEQFDLAISLDRSITRHCKLIWRDGAAVGVRFVKAAPEKNKAEAASASASS